MVKVFVRVSFCKGFIFVILFCIICFIVSFLYSCSVDIVFVIVLNMFLFGILFLMFCNLIFRVVKKKYLERFLIIFFSFYEYILLYVCMICFEYKENICLINLKFSYY